MTRLEFIKRILTQPQEKAVIYMGEESYKKLTTQQNKVKLPSAVKSERTILKLK